MIFFIYLFCCFSFLRRVEAKKIWSVRHEGDFFRQVLNFLYGSMCFVVHTRDGVWVKKRVKKIK